MMFNLIKWVILLLIVFFYYLNKKGGNLCNVSGVWILENGIIFLEGLMEMVV